MGETVQFSEEENEAFRKSVPGAMVKTPFLSGLGIEVVKYEHDDISIRLPFREDLTNDGIFYHGGVIASVIDTAGAAAAWSNHDFNKGMKASTISMTIQYVGACKKSDLICNAKALKRGKELIFTEIEGRDDKGQLVAHAIQTYRIV